MRFANPEYLYLLIILPVAIALYLYSGYRRKRILEKYGEPQLIGRLMPSRNKLRTRITFWVSLLAMALIVVALARPRYGEGKQTITTKGVEAVIALDISNSMMAEDITPNRLEKAKMVVRRLARQLQGSKIGLIVFAGDAFVQMPITDDFVSVDMFLESIKPDLIELQGTDIAAAIDLASKSFTQNEYIGKAIIVITDGENHEGGAAEAAQRANEMGLNLFVLGVGTDKGGQIPDGRNGFLRNSSGEIVVSKLNEEMAQSIAQAGNGTYIRVDNTASAQEILSAEFEKLAKDEVKTDIYTRYNEVFNIVMAVVFILLFTDILVVACVDFFASKKRNRKENK